MKTYTIMCHETCPDCGGSGILSDPIYEEFAAARHELKGDYNRECQWFVDRGYGWGVLNWPKEEYNCSNCNGSGEYHHEVDFKEVVEKYLGGEL